MNPKVDMFLSQVEKWQPELELLRSIILDCGLTEELKWNVPIYTSDKKNIVGINGLKEYCALAFFKGALLKDEQHILIRPGQHTQAARWVKFTSVKQIARLEPVLKAYITEALEIEKAGLKIQPKKTEDFPVPEEFQSCLDKMTALRKAFDTLTPGRQRSYLFYFSQPKQSQTRIARIEKLIPKILAGKGLNDH